MGSAGQKDLLRGEVVVSGLSEVPGWVYLAERGAIERRLSFLNFRVAFSFMSDVGELAEEADHHPEWCNVWNRVDIVLTTHSAGGPTRKDLALAHDIDALVRKYGGETSAKEDQACSVCLSG